MERASSLGPCMLELDDEFSIFCCATMEKGLILLINAVLGIT